VGRRFLRRVALTIALVFALTVAANGLTYLLLSRILGIEAHRRVLPFGAVLVISLIVAAVASVRAARRIARPMAEVMEAAERVAGGDYGVRVDERGPRDLRRLARSFNAMTERLEAGEARRRDLLADIAHELRTPLSVIQGNAEGMLDGLYPADRAHLEPVIEEARVMSRLLEDLRTLSTAEAGALRLHREPADPKRLVEDAVASFRARADERGVMLEARAANGLTDLDVDPVRIGEVLANLLSNALRHTPRGGRVQVSVEPGTEPGAVAFAVADTGPGIAEDLLPHVFDRFVTAAAAGPGAGAAGAGLGLAIARRLVEAHGGTIAAENAPQGGATIRFTLPTASS